MQSTCEVCNKVFDHKTGKVRRFCSTECRKSVKITGLGDMRCQQCGGPIRGERYAGKRFCCRQCFADHLSQSLKGVERPSVRGPKPHMQNRVTLTCQRCGKEYQVKKSHEHRSKYCSKECTKNQCDIQCKQCGKTYAVKAAEAERTRFCSRECYAEWMTKQTGPSNPRWKRIEVTCANCCKTLHKVKSDLADKKVVFCDAQCYGEWYSKNMAGENAPNWLGGMKSWRGASWKRQRVLALKRDNHTCQHCGVTQKQLDKLKLKSAKLQVHHIIPFRNFGLDRESDANQLTNLIVLCPICHMKAENQLIPIQPSLLPVP